MANDQITSLYVNVQSALAAAARLEEKDGRPKVIWTNSTFTTFIVWDFFESPNPVAAGMHRPLGIRWKGRSYDYVPSGLPHPSPRAVLFSSYYSSLHITKQDARVWLRADGKESMWLPMEKRPVHPENWVGAVLVERDSVRVDAELEDLLHEHEKAGSRILSGIDR